MVEFITVEGNEYFVMLPPTFRIIEIGADVDFLRYAPEISYCEIKRWGATGRDPNTRYAFTHHICAEHNIVVNWQT